MEITEPFADPDADESVRTVRVESSNNLGTVLRFIGKYPESEASYQQALAIAEASSAPRIRWCRVC